MGSVEYLESVKLNLNPVNCEVRWTGSSLDIDYDYRVKIENIISARENVISYINTVNSINVDNDYLDKTEVFNCARGLFDYISDSYICRFYKENGETVGQIIKRDLYRVADLYCSNFDVEIIPSVPCVNCDCLKMSPVNITVKLEKNNKKIYFYTQFNNFQCGAVTKCYKNTDCGAGEFCINRICMPCIYNIGKICSEGDFPRKCYKTDTGEYRCLRAYDNLYLVDKDNKKYTQNNIISVNCGKTDKSEYSFNNKLNIRYVKLNDVKIQINSDTFDLCDNRFPRDSGKLEIYITDSGYTYKVFDISVDYTLSKCINTIKTVLDNHYYIFDEMDCNDLKNEVEKEVKNKIITEDCDGYMVVADADITCSGDISWYDLKYSNIMLTFYEIDSYSESAKSYIIVRYLPNEY